MHILYRYIHIVIFVFTCIHIGVASVHPNKTTEVIHPDFISGKGTIHNRGSVCGIEQIKGTLRFVVEFGSYRELWNGRKVRKYGVASESERTDEEFKLMYLDNEMNAKGKK
jgi:hypothetical protein